MPSVSTFVGRFKSLLRSFYYPEAAAEAAHSLIIESDFDHDKFKTKLDGPDTSSVDGGNMDLNGKGVVSYNVMGDSCETLHVSQEIQFELDAAIRDWCEKDATCSRLVFQKDLLARIAQDIVRMSVAEPCGVRGCAIHIRLQEKDKCFKVASVYGDGSTPPTFEIYLTLKEDNRPWRTFQKAYLTVKGCILNSEWTSTPKIISPAYQLEKRKLYRV